MRLAIIGAGAIGSVVGGHLARAGHEVTLICRGAHRAAIASHGLTLRSGDGGEFVTRPAVSERPEDFGPQDGLILTAKAYSLPELAPRLAGMLGPDTAVMSTQNGLPWWYLHGVAEEGGGRAFAPVDPDGVLWNTLGPRRCVGASANIQAIIREPGLVAFAVGPRLTFGAVDPVQAGFVAAFADAVTASGIAVTIDDPRTVVWTKLRGYISIGPLCALTQTAPAALRQIPGMPEVQARLTGEMEAVARAWGVELPPPVPRPAVAPAGGTGMPSMWQDYEAGKPLELDAILEAPIELGRRRGVDTATIATVLALLRAKLAWRERQNKG